MKRLLLILTLSTLLFACNKEQLNSRRLYIGEGKWKIESIQYLVFDSTGTPVSDSTVTDFGELIFLKTQSLDGLWDYRLGVWITTDTAGNHAKTFQYVFDGERIHIDGSGFGLKGNVSAITGVYTVSVNKKQKQVWETTSVKSNGAAFTSLGSKTIMTLKKE